MLRELSKRTNLSNMMPDTYAILSKRVSFLMLIKLPLGISNEHVRDRASYCTACYDGLQ